MKRRLSVVLLGCCVSFVVALAPAAFANDIAVTTHADTSSTTDGCSLREAIAAASTNMGVDTCPPGAAASEDRILLGNGSYPIQQIASSDTNANGDFDVAAAGPVRISGVGAGATTIDGGGLSRVFDIGTGATVIIEKLKITGGFATHGTDGTSGVGSGSSATSGARGGGVQNRGDLTIRNASIYDNTSGLGGTGGTGSGPDGTFSSLDGADASGGAGGNGGNGGGIYNFAGHTLTIENSVVAVNHAGDGGAGGGASGGDGFSQSLNPGGNGGDANAGPAGNGGNGGGIYNAGTLRVTNSVISDNGTGRGGPGGTADAGQPGGGSTNGIPGSATAGSGGHGGDGAGIDSPGEMTLIATTLARNRSGDGGAGGDSTPGVGDNGMGGTITGASVSGAGGDGGNGGGVTVSSAAAHTATNVTLAGNRAGGGRVSGSASPGGPPPQDGSGGSGGGVRTTQTGQFTLTHATISGNLAGAGASGVGPDGPDGTGPAVKNDPGGTTTVRNTIVTDACAGTVTDGLHSLAFNAPGCPGAVGDPKLGPLENNGGPTPTMALGTGSAARNQIPATGANCQPFDQRGVKRPYGPGCDIGAFEFRPPPKDVTPPRVTGLAVNPNVFAVAAAPTPLNAAETPKGTTIRFTLSERSTAKLAIQQKKAGLKLRGANGKTRCVAATKKNKKAVLAQLRKQLGPNATKKQLAKALRKARCTRWIQKGVLTRKGIAGLNRVPFSGRLGTKALRPSRYRVVVKAKDAAGNVSKPATAPFRIVSAK